MDTYTASMLGSAVGLILACLPIYLIGLLAGLLMKAKDPDERAMYAAMIAWVAVFVIAGFGFARAETFNFGAGLFYIPAAGIAFLMLRHHYRDIWVEDE